MSAIALNSKTIDGLSSQNLNKLDKNTLIKSKSQILKSKPKVEKKTYQLCKKISMIIVTESLKSNSEILIAAKELGVNLTISSMSDGQFADKSTDLREIDTIVCHVQPTSAYAEQIGQKLLAALE